MTSFERSKSAFTLVELLVVIAVIALLAAISFPVFGRARENARRSSCQSNNKQIALAVLQYAQDFDETLPPVAYEDALGEDVVWPQMIRPYTKSAQIFKCPSDTKSVSYSYGLNELAFVDLEDDPDDPVLKLAAFANTTQTVMLGDVGLNVAGEADTLKMVEPGDAPDDDLDGAPAPRHLEFATLAFMDGHVKSFKLEQFYVGQTPLDKFFRP